MRRWDRLQEAYDDADRLTSVTDPAGNVTQYIYDTENNLLSITDANGHSTTFTYDAFGRVTQTTFPSNYFETYAYDADNNLTSKTDRKSQTIQYVYDALNRLTKKTYPDSTTAEYTNDLVGKILQVNDPTGTFGFAYDNVGRLIGTTTQYAFLAQQQNQTSPRDPTSLRKGKTEPGPNSGIIQDYQVVDAHGRPVRKVSVQEHIKVVIHENVNAAPNPNPVYYLNNAQISFDLRVETRIPTSSFFRSDVFSAV